jgi:hypothetical protein
MKNEEYWRTKDGEVIAVSDMDEDHAKNCLRMLIRRDREEECDATEADLY